MKVPVAIEVLRGIERGDDFTLDTLLTLRAADYIDGTVRPTAMASAPVNALVQSLVPERFRTITSLADVRRDRGIPGAGGGRCLRRVLGERPRFARLDADGELLKLLFTGRALGPAGTAHLLDVMGRVKTGLHRIQAGVPPRSHFTQKTGTQSVRTCDSCAENLDENKEAGALFKRLDRAIT